MAKKKLQMLIGYNVRCARPAPGLTGMYRDNRYWTADKDTFVPAEEMTDAVMNEPRLKITEVYGEATADVRVPEETPEEEAAAESEQQEG